MMDCQIDPGFQKNQFTHEEWGDDYIDYRLKWNTNPGRGIVEDYPLNLDIEVTNRCNLGCEFCVREYYRNEKTGKLDWEQGDMDPDTFFGIMGEIAGKVPAVKLNWRGEPMLHPDLPAYVNATKEIGQAVEVMINTNGTLMNGRRMADLIESKIDRIIFSIDSIEESRYNKMRINADFNKVIMNVKAAVAYRNALDKDWKKGRPYFRVQKIDLPETRDEWDFVDYFRNLGVDTVAINSYKEKDDGKVEWEPLSCAQPFQRMVVAWNGDFYPCCQGHLFKPIGNFRDMTVHEAWHSEVMENLRHKHLNGIQKEIEACRHCETTRPEK